MISVDVLPEMKGLEWGRLYEEYHSKAEGHVTLANHADWSRVDLNREYSLALADGRRCPVTMNYHGPMPATTFSVACSPADLV